MNDLGVIITKVPPYHPQSNGSAEKYVWAVKTVFNKFVLGKGTGLSIQDKINKFLLHQKSTPSTVTKCAPMELVFKYKPKTMLDAINYKVKQQIDLKENCNESQKHKQKNQKIESNKNGKSKSHDFGVGENVLYRNHFKNSVKWLPAKVIKK